MSKPKIAIVIATFQREQHLQDLIHGWIKVYSESVNYDLTLVLVNDDPNSDLDSYIRDVLGGFPGITIYIKNIKRQGQGRVLINTIENIPAFDYYWCFGDDDRILPIPARRFLELIASQLPTVAVCEFRQGSSLLAGTWFSGEARLIRDTKDCYEHLMRFGKLSNLVFSRPSMHSMELVSTHFLDSMYQDRAYAVMAYLEAGNPSVLVFPELTAHGTSKFGVLRYSQRVFVNLGRTMQLGLSLHQGPESVDLAFLAHERSTWVWWWSGILSHFHPKSEIRYTRKRLALELVYPFRRLFRKMSREPSYFEKN